MKRSLESKPNYSSVIRTIAAILLVLCTASQISCARKNVNVDIPEAQPVSVSKEKPVAEKTPYRVYIESEDYKLALYEPQNGVYAGAYINSGVLSEIDDFEAQAGEHVMYVAHYKLGDAFPINWLLDVMAHNKLPYIVITAQNSYDPYDLELLAKAAAEVGRFYVPIFVDLYPNADLDSYNPKEYVNFYRQAHEIFNEHASNAALVFSVSSQDAAAALYYPGNEYADWVGINVKTGADGNADEISASIEKICRRFQKEKPLIISSLAVGHISAADHVYKTEKAQQLLSEIYRTVSERYPRIKGINYINIDCLGESAGYYNEELEEENYLVTDEEAIKAAYKKAITGEGFTREAAYQSAGEADGEYLITAYDAYLHEGEMYISADVFYNEINLKGVSSIIGESLEIDGEDYFRLELLKNYSLKKVQVDEARRIVYLGAL
ncbi:MAG: hypothetical protein LBS21_08290 [Clostridiales bacterium]|jgi:hypothetical protein|nr:hypothetical protein [Clostridiales bacterium]